MTPIINHRDENFEYW